MDCGLCRGHLRDKQPCAGCNGDPATLPEYCLTCKIRTCDVIASGASTFCFDCTGFPCARLRQLDKRYRTRYGMSMVENLLRIRQVGVEAFVAAEKTKWTCPECGALLCVHRPQCGGCGRIWNVGVMVEDALPPQRRRAR
jgi:hypothetical protein